MGYEKQLELRALVNRGFASYKELMNAGMIERINLGVNKFGLTEYIIIDDNFGEWEWNPREWKYEYKGGLTVQIMNKMSISHE